MNKATTYNYVYLKYPNIIIDIIKELNNKYKNFDCFNEEKMFIKPKEINDIFYKNFRDSIINYDNFDSFNDSLYLMMFDKLPLLYNLTIANIENKFSEVWKNLGVKKVGNSDLHVEGDNTTKKNPIVISLENKSKLNRISATEFLTKNFSNMSTEIIDLKNNLSQAVQNSLPLLILTWLENFRDLFTNFPKEIFNIVPIDCLKDRKWKCEDFVGKQTPEIWEIDTEEVLANNVKKIKIIGTALKTIDKKNNIIILQIDNGKDGQSFPFASGEKVNETFLIGNTTLENPLIRKEDINTKQEKIVANDVHFVDEMNKLFHSSDFNNQFNDKQNKQDNNLTTTSKQIVGSINELNNNKQNKQDENLETLSKNIVGAINELNSKSPDLSNYYTKNEIDNLLKNYVEKSYSEWEFFYPFLIGGVSMSTKLEMLSGNFATRDDQSQLKYYHFTSFSWEFIKKFKDNIDFRNPNVVWHDDVYKLEIIYEDEEQLLNCLLALQGVIKNE